jgi:hypothetical protein
LAEEDAKAVRKRKAKVEQERAKKKVNNLINQAGLQSQGVMSTDVDLLATESISPVSESVSSTSSVYSTSMNLIESLQKTIADSIAANQPTAAADGASEADKELERELKRSQIRAAQAQEMYYLRLANNNSAPHV